MIASILSAVALGVPDDPGKFFTQSTKEQTTLGNQAISVEAGRRFSYRNEQTKQTIFYETDGFTINYRNGKGLRASQVAAFLWIDPQDLYDPANGLKVTWRIARKDGTAYLRKVLTLSATKQDVDVSRITLIDAKIPGAKVAGTVPGSPIASETAFVGLEYPRSASKIVSGRAQCWIDRKVPIRKGQSVTYSAVIGVAPAGQLRRAFNQYLESERPRKYSSFLHYNSWYDLGHYGMFNADECVERIRQFGVELVQKRGVKLSSYLFDDGWDDTSTVWQFHKGFPQGFAPLLAEARKFDSRPGIWLSPWGGYSRPREERLAAGKKAGMEIDQQGYALSGPHYYKVFHDFCMNMVQKYGVNQFKFDGTGSPDKQYPGSAFDSDFDAAISLISDLRKAQPKLFVNLTTGTWPSPFWTRYADSVWRGGADHSFAGVGTPRQRWITYRDGDTFNGVVKRGPLYPLSSLMLHGILFARDAGQLTTDPGNDLKDEIRSYFGAGTQLQELYITPTQMSSGQWDELARMAKWSQANRDVLVDTHWVGGDPLKLEVYGWAAWSPKKAILTLRNPSDKPQAFSIDPRKVFELPKGINGTFDLGLYPSTLGTEHAIYPIKVGETMVMELKPFEVVVFEGEMS